MKPIHSDIPDSIPELEEVKHGVYACDVCDYVSQTLPSHGKCPECLQRYEDGEGKESL